MKKNMYRPVLMGLAIAALLISALAATSYPAHAALSAHAAIGGAPTWADDLDRGNPPATFAGGFP
jgi:hypothetical protein